MSEKWAEEQYKEYQEEINRTEKCPEGYIWVHSHSDNTRGTFVKGYCRKNPRRK